MPSAKKKATAKTAVKFRDLKAKKNPKGGPIYVKYEPAVFIKGNI